MFQVARSWGVQPSEFWRMSLMEFFWEYDIRRPDREHVRLLHHPGLTAIMEKPPGGWPEANRRKRVEANKVLG